MMIGEIIVVGILAVAWISLVVYVIVRNEKDKKDFRGGRYLDN